MPFNKACKKSQNGIEWNISYLPSDVPKEPEHFVLPFPGSINIISSPMS